MAKRRVDLALAHATRDGTSQRSRALGALDPSYVAVDEQSQEELLRFVQALSSRLRYFSASAADEQPSEAGSWAEFANHAELGTAEILAYLREPERFTGGSAEWLGRPHFALLLTFLELFRHARAELRGLTRRHLDFYFKDVLHLTPKPATPDRAVVAFRLAARADDVRLPAGTELDAGRDSAGVPRRYVTERELLVGRAQIEQLRSVYVHRRVTTIPSARRDRQLTAAQALNATLRIALGKPRPGDAVPPWTFESGPARAIDRQFLVDVAKPSLDFASTRLFITHPELQRLMLLKRRRDDAAREWTAINRRLGFPTPPANPTAFLANLQQRVGPLDFSADQLPQVANVDDLFWQRNDPQVRAFIEARLEPNVHYQDFVVLMPIKLRIDAEWREINELVQRIGRRARNDATWRLDGPGFVPEAFADNLRAALAGAWPPPWSSISVSDIAGYEQRVRRLEQQLSMPVHRLEELAEFALDLAGSDQAESFDWTGIDSLLADAHRESVFAGRRAKLAQDVAGGAQNLAAFLAVSSHVLQLSPPTSDWATLEAKLSELLSRPQLDVLSAYRSWLLDETAPRRFEWADALRVFELAQRLLEQLPDPVARKSEWRNLFASEDARLVTDSLSTGRWKTFGGLPAPSAAAAQLGIGWAVTSAALDVGSGRRELFLTHAFSEGFDTLLSELPGDLAVELAAVLQVEVTTAKGWLTLTGTQVSFVRGSYFALLGVPLPSGQTDLPGLQLRVVLAAEDPALAPLAGEAHATLRVRLRQLWDDAAKEWTTSYTPFERLVLARVHLNVNVEGLRGLRLQADDRAVDPKKPFMPFGTYPVAGSRFHLGHPELSRARLDELRLLLEWTDLPKDAASGAATTLAKHYTNYPGDHAASSFTCRVLLDDRGSQLGLATARALFQDSGGGSPATQSTVSVNIGVASVLATQSSRYEQSLEWRETSDVRAAGRCVTLELSRAFGHGVFPGLSAAKSRALAAALSAGPVSDLSPYQVQPPYTPTLRELKVGYRTSIEFTLAGDPAQLSKPNDSDRLLHVHPFGVADIDPASPLLFPRYEQAGELYLGLRELAAPTRLSLMFQVAEGTSDPDIEAKPLSWSYLDGVAWQDLRGSGALGFDSTRGLINSGIVELALPSASPGERMPPGVYWLRVAIADDTTAACDMVEVRPQATTARFVDRGNAPLHYAQPLPSGSIKRLLRRDARITDIEQPFTSFGGRPAEQPATFDNRVSERLRHKRRALSPWDYERLVLQEFPSVYKVKCLPSAVTGRAGSVDMVVIPDIRRALPADLFAPRASSALLADVRELLVERAPPDARITVRNPKYVQVLIRLGARFGPDVAASFAVKQLNQDLIRFLSPWAFDETAELTIGGRIFETSVMDFADRLDYVDFVTDLKLFRIVDDVPFLGVDGFVEAAAPDQVLVSAREHFIDVIPELDYEQSSFAGINYMKVELDFIVG